MSSLKERERLRLLVKANKKVVHKLALYEEDGTLKCRVCKKVVEPSQWDKHLVSSDHVERIRQLKEPKKVESAVVEKEEQVVAPVAPVVVVEDDGVEEEEKMEPMVVVQVEPTRFVDLDVEMAKFASSLTKGVGSSTKDFDDVDDVKKQTTQGSAVVADDDDDDDAITTGVAASLEAAEARKKRQKLEDNNDGDADDDDDVDIFADSWRQ